MQVAKAGRIIVATQIGTSYSLAGAHVTYSQSLTRSAPDKALYKFYTHDKSLYKSGVTLLFTVDCTANRIGCFDRSVIKLVSIANKSTTYCSR